MKKTLLILVFLWIMPEHSRHKAKLLNLLRRDNAQSWEVQTLKKEPFKAIIDSSASRIRAVSLAAGTTVLGMIPLMFDPLFSDMAITIVFGLTITTNVNSFCCAIVI